MWGRRDTPCGCGLPTIGTHFLESINPYISLHKTGCDVSITLREQVDQRDLRLASENGWMDRLDTLLPHGLNTRINLY